MLDKRGNSNSDERIDLLIPNPNRITPIPSPANRRGEVSSPADTGGKQVGFGIIENFFVKLKPYRAIFTCHDKLAETFLRSQRYLYGYRATSIIWLIWSHALGR
jgi:hypothetical protein